jgi:hypothetical protein
VLAGGGSVGGLTWLARVFPNRPMQPFWMRAPIVLMSAMPALPALQAAAPAVRESTNV